MGFACLDLYVLKLLLIVKKKRSSWISHRLVTGIFILFLFFVFFGMVNPDLYGIGFDDDSYGLV